MRRRTVTAVLAGSVAVAAVLALALIRGSSADEAESPSASRALESFESVASGVALMEALDCDGKPLVVSDGVAEHRVRGTGFLVGSRVLMGVEHMIPPTPGVVCGFRARLRGRWYAVADVHVWSERGERDRRGIDLATASLSRSAPGHVFRFAPETVSVGTTLTLLGHPLGGALRESKGVVTKKLMEYGKPTLAARFTPEIEGGDSGAPLLNDRGEVVSVLSRIVVPANLTPDGKHHNGGIDLAGWWGNDAVRSDLCRTYPRGGIAGCDATSSEPVKVPVRVALTSTR
jgi:hypothetical protein